MIPVPCCEQAEATFVSGMLFLFGLVLLEGLLIAGSVSNA
jgi:hypothetical protein